MALSAAERFDQSLSKIQLQKFIYLQDVVEYFYRVFPPAKAYDTYKNGPYDVDIQNAADALVFRGLLNVSISKLSTGTLAANYRLSTFGKLWVSDLLSIDDTESRSKASNLVADQIHIVGWKNLIKLVYADPTYVANQPKGHGQAIDITNRLEPSSAFLANLIRTKIQRGNKAVQITPEQLSKVFFRYLVEYSRLRKNRFDFENEE